MAGRYWRDKWAAPLYATGAEFLFCEKAWEQGEMVSPKDAGAYDVPTFFRHARAILDDDTPEEEKVERIFGGSRLGKYCSLNVDKVLEYGTVEFRRMHPSTDPDHAVSWALFCVTFVETFQDTRLASAYLAVPVEDGLRALQRDQETATRADLAELLPHPGASTLARLARDACGAHIRSNGLA